MPSDDEWQAHFDACPRDYLVTAHSYRGIRYLSYSSPVVLGCDDGEDYVVKAATDQVLFRAICNDQVMGHVAAALVAPVPAVKIVNIPQELIDGEADLAGFPAGPAHGSRYMPNTSKTRQGIEFQNLPDNRERFALLALMYGLAKVDGDHQFFYEDGSNRVWSFDHGHFFPNGPDWTIQSLAACPGAVPDSKIVDGCQLTQTELADAQISLQNLTAQEIAKSAASPDDSWRLEAAERLALAKHLHTRSEHLQQ